MNPPPMFLTRWCSQISVLQVKSEKLRIVGFNLMVSQLAQQPGTWCSVKNTSTLFSWSPDLYTTYVGATPSRAYVYLNRKSGPGSCGIVVM